MLPQLSYEGQYVQTYSYSRHFLSTCIRVCGYETNLRGIDVEGHVTAVMHCPVGIDAERVARDMCVHCKFRINYSL
jgi:trehalose-6-phosphate synthase